MSLDLSHTFPVVICDDCANYTQAGSKDMTEAIAYWRLKGWAISRQNKTHQCPRCSSGWKTPDNSWVV